MEREDEIAEDQVEGAEEAPEAGSSTNPKRVIADWEEDEAAFAKHFGITIEDFQALVLLLSPSQNRRYLRTLKVNKEAAILWAIHEGKSHGLLTETGNG